MSKLLSIDLSTACTGFALFNRETKELLEYGHIKPKVKGLHKFKYPEATLLVILDMTEKVGQMIDRTKPDRIVIEEINRGISRIGQKGLSAIHFFVLHSILVNRPELIKTLVYLDSNGKKGWRPILGLKLSDQDKQVNAEIRNKNRRKGAKKAPKIDWKVLAQRWVNKRLSKSFNVWEKKSDSDEVDSICIGLAYLLYLDK